MPLYEYRCENCGNREERLQGLSAPDCHDCPECDATAGMRRQLSVAAFALSGGGWYKEGYGGNGKAPEAAPAKPADAGPAPAAKADAAAPKPAGGCSGGCACH